MKTKLLCYLAIALLIISSCGEKSDKEEPKTIDVSKQWLITIQGEVISSPGDDQWQSKTFTMQELNLFSSLDTANLYGTSTPDSVIETPQGYNTSYPNPFMTVFALSLRFPDGYSGQIVLKCVIVDSTMTSQFKLASRLYVPDSYGTMTFNPAIPVGKYRFFYTLSTQSDPHFYQSWGNIQKEL